MKGQSISLREEALSLAACISDDESLQPNLLASPCLDSRFHHDVVAVRNCPSAAAGLNFALERACARIRRLRSSRPLLAG